MTTAIDQALSAFIAAITPTPGVTGVFEDRSLAYTHDDAPAIDVSLQDATSDTLGDQHPLRSVLRVTVQIDMAIYVRTAVDAAGNEVPTRSMANDVWAAAHALLMADPTFGGQALRTRWKRSTWRKDAADGTAGWAVHSYELLLAVREQSLLST